MQASGRMPEAAPLYSSDTAGLVLGKMQVAENWVPFVRGELKQFLLRDVCQKPELV